ncbi:MAG: hypothetical protein AAGG00_12075 [Cyanobacteria bacterium P01_H01_bin.150]
MQRYWLGTEIGDTSGAVQRLNDLADGKFEEWESARGKINKKNQTDSRQLDLFS